jgi:hypothetical protein
MSNPQFPATACVCFDPGEGCMCGDAERALRAYTARRAGLPPMTPTQRQWCLGEIGRVEGYELRDYENAHDDVLAGATLCACREYCRDKGLL